MTRKSIVTVVCLLAISLASSAGAQNYCPADTIVTASPAVGEELYVPPVGVDDWDRNARNISAVCRGEATPKGTTLPGTCTVGTIFFGTDAAAGSNLFGCTSTDFWTLLSGGGSGGSAIEIVDLQKSSAQSIPNDTFTDLTWETEREDVEGYHAANADEIIIPVGKAGVFQIECGVAFASGAGDKLISIWIGSTGAGVTIANQRTPDTGAANFTNLAVSRVRRLPDGERVACSVYQTSGGALNANAINQTFMVVTRLGD